MQHLPRERMPPRLADARYSRDPVCNQTTNSTMTHPDISPGSCRRPAWRGILIRLSARVSQKARLAFVDMRSLISSDAAEPKGPRLGASLVGATATAGLRHRRDFFALTSAQIASWCRR